MKFKEYIILYMYPNRFWGIFGSFLVNLSSIFSLRDKCFGLWGVASLSETGKVNEMKDWEAARSTDYLSRRVSFGHFWALFLVHFGRFWFIAGRRSLTKHR
jgi:hypothetical protein